VRIELSPRFRRTARRYRDADLDRIQATLDAILEGFGLPHAHAGLGVRKLRGGWFECRAGRDIRLVFLAEKDTLTFHLAAAAMTT
jgi:hypothetical protein